MASLEDLTTNELLAHTRAQDVKLRLYDPLMNDPETRPEMLRLLKKKNPGMPIPELDNADAMEKKLAIEREAREKLEQKLMEERVDRDIAEKRARVKREYDLSDEDLKAVEKMMVEDQIGTYDGAAKVLRASRQQATPTPHMLEAPVYDMPEKDIWGRGIGRPAELNRTAVKVATAAWNDIASGRVKLTNS